MSTKKSIHWFKAEIAPTLSGYQLEYRFFESGDFGSLDQVIFNSIKKGGGIDFWGTGWLGIDLYDYEKDKLFINVLLEPIQHKEKEIAVQQLVQLLIS